MLNVDWSGSCETPAGGVQLSASRARPRSDEVLSEETRGSPAESEHMERKSTGRFNKA